MESVFLIFFDTIVIPVNASGHFGRELTKNNPKRAFVALAMVLVELPRSLTVNIANIARGIIEMVPVIGNIAAFGFDKLSYTYRKWQNGILSKEELENARREGEEKANTLLEKRVRNC
jgi:hypothetical protein